MKKPYRSKEFNDERKWKAKSLLDDVTQVGKQKAMGYVLVETDKQLNLFKKKFGKQLTYYKSWGRNYSTPTFWVGDKKMIQDIINNNKDLLIKNDWSLDASEVFNRICIYDVDHEYSPELYHFITDLFNSWCLWCEKPIMVSGKSQPDSASPFDPDEIQ